MPDAGEQHIAPERLRLDVPADGDLGAAAGPGALPRPGAEAGIPVVALRAVGEPAGVTVELDQARAAVPARHPGHVHGDDPLSANVERRRPFDDPLDASVPFG